MKAAPATLLLLDVGNSRLKWALVQGAYARGRPFARSGAFGLERLESHVAALQRLLAAVNPAGSILACNVAGAALERRLAALARSAGAPRPRFARTVRAAAGVHNAYSEPWRLGADRWAALVGAHAEYPHRPLCLVAVGTALTIDVMDARGRHRGGSIVPGPALMMDSLLDRTAGIRRRAGGRRAVHAIPPRRQALFARDTRSAIAGGAVNAAAALIHESMRAARELLGLRPLLIIGGGGADDVARQLRQRHQRRDDLALRGLAVLHSVRAQFE